MPYFNDFTVELNDIGGYTLTDYRSYYNEYIEIPSYFEGLKINKIGKYAFSRKDKIKKIIIPATVEHIDKYAFYTCKSLKEIKFEDENSISIIAEGAFYDIPLTGVFHISDKCSFIGVGAFSGTRISEFTINDAHPIYSVDEKGLLYNKSKTEIVSCPPRLQINSLSIMSSVNFLAERAFSDCINLELIELSPNINKIGKACFSSCSRLRSIDLSMTKLEELDDLVFFGCKKLIYVSLPDSVTRFGTAAFESCESLVEIKLPMKLSILGESVFSFCKLLSKIKLPSSLLRIEKNAFRKCNSLIELELRSNIEYIGVGAISECENLNKVTFHKNSRLKKIEVAAFSMCKNLISIKLPISIDEIPSSCFRDCTNLEKIEIEDINNLVSCPSDAIQGCYKLKSLIGFDKVTNFYLKDNWERRRYYDEALQEVFDELSKRAGFDFELSSCGNIYKVKRCIPYGEDIVIPEMFNGLPVREIMTNAFAHTSVKRLSIPKTINRIQKEIFGERIDNYTSTEQINIDCSDVQVEDCIFDFRGNYGFIHNEAYNNDFMVTFGENVRKVPDNLLKKWKEYFHSTNSYCNLTVVSANKELLDEYYNVIDNYAVYKLDLYYGNINDSTSWKKYKNKL